MKVFTAMTHLPLILQLSCAGATGMTRQRFQSVVHTLVDDELAMLSESLGSVEVNTSSAGSPLSGFHDRTLSKTSKRSSPSKLRSHHVHSSDETDDDDSAKLDDLFDSIVNYGWDMILSRSLESVDSEEMFLVCHRSSVASSTDRLHKILEYLDMSDADNLFYEPVHSTLDEMCIILSISTKDALKWYGANNTDTTNDDLVLIPWTDAMKIAPGVISQMYSDSPILSNVTSDYSVVFSVAMNGRGIVDHIVADVIGLIRGKQSERRQQQEYHPLHDVFSLIRMTEKLAIKSNDNWSRTLKASDCTSMLDSFVISQLNSQSIYQFDFTSSTSYDCIVTIIVAIAVQPTVSRVGVKTESIELHNIHASWAVQGGVEDNDGYKVFPFTAAGLDGKSQVVSISDTGLDVMNCYFRDESSNDSEPDSIFEHWSTSKRKILRYDYDTSGGDLSDYLSGHGTHVSATIIGSHMNGIGRDKEGIAPAAKGHFFDICTANKCLSPTKKWFNSMNSNLRVKPVVLSASWGTGYLSSYDWTCHQYDQLVFDNPEVLLVSSSGNLGESSSGPFHTIGAPASCKNVLAVGATFTSQFGHDSAVASFSSRGPSSDGRIKPDILAPGFKLNSAIAGQHDCSREEPKFLRAGTSMSTPVVSGLALLIKQYFEEGFYPCGYRGCGREIVASGSLVKAVLLNGAQFQKEIIHASTGAFRGELAPYDNTQGFGAVNLLLSLPLYGHENFGLYVKNESALRWGQKHSFELIVDSVGCKSDFSVTLAWNDPPATVGCTSCLVNDLDLVVVDMSTWVKYYPNGKVTPDRINNVERIRIANGSISSKQKFRITVSTARLGLNYDTQKYSVVATGCFVSPDENFNQQRPSKSSETPVTTHSTEHELMTSYRLMSKHRAAGIMFSVKARSPGVIVNSFSVTTHLNNDGIVYVYKLKETGRHLNSTELSDESSWEMISPFQGFAVNATGSRDLTVLPKDAFQVSIPEGSVQPFYITFSNERGIVCGRPRWNNKHQRNKKRDANIKIDGGVGRLKQFGGRVIDPCYLDGSVAYSLQHTEELF